MSWFPTLSPCRLLVVLSAVVLGSLAACLASTSSPATLWIALMLLGTVVAVGFAQLFPWLGAGLGLVAAGADAMLEVLPSGARAPGVSLAPAILVLAGLLAELAGRRFSRIERDLVLGEQSPARRALDLEQAASVVQPQIGRSLARELDRARRYRFSVALALLEIGRWDELLGVYGRARMLEVVNEFSQRLRESLRLQDDLSYVGRGRFAVVLPHTEISGALTVTERAREALPAWNELTLGVGLAEFPEDAATEAELFSEAEAALEADLRARGDPLGARTS